MSDPLREAGKLPDGERRADLRGFRLLPGRPWVTCLLIAANTAVFLIGVFAQGIGRETGLIFSRGALYAPVLFKGQELHRLFTSMFLHADAGHLVNNMIVLFAGGGIVEKNLGHVRYAVLYLASGLVGNAVSVLTDYLTRSYGFSVGASGAVFGVIGALVFMILSEVRRLAGRGGSGTGEGFSPFKGAADAGKSAAGKGGSGAGEDRFPFEGAADAGKSSAGSVGSGAGEGVSPAMKSLLVRTVLMTAYLLYSGWANPAVNQAAHLGGILSGFLLCALLMSGDRRGVDLEELLR